MTIVATTADLLAVAAYDLGFIPTDSLVLASLHGPRRTVGLIARIDLTDAIDAAPALLSHMLADNATGVAVLIYGGQPADNAHTLAVLVTTAGLAGLPVTDALHVDATTWQALDLDGDQCGQPVGPHVPYNTDTTVIAATMVAKGRTIAPNRAGLDITPAPPTDQDAATAIYQACGPLTPGQTLTIWRTIREQRTVSPTAAGTLTSALDHTIARDTVLADLVDPDGTTAVLVAAGDTDAAARTISYLFGPGHQPDQQTAADIETLYQVAALHDTAPIRTLLAIMSWWSGNGARANVHAAAALTLDPTYQLALLIDQALALATPPGWARH